jgi:hypothetical protein
MNKQTGLLTIDDDQAFLKIISILNNYNYSDSLIYKF